MNPQIEVMLDESLVKRAHGAFVCSHCGFTVRGFLTGLAPFAVLGIIGLLLRGAWVYVGVAIFAVGLGFASWSGWWMWRLYRKKLTDSAELLGRMKRPCFRYSFADDGVRVESELSSSSMTWKSFRKLSRLDDLWLLYITNTRYLVLPTRQLPQELQDFVVQKCREHEIPVT